MHRNSATVFCLMIAVFFFSSLWTGNVAEEAGSDHHEHPGLTDASAASEHHKHGDSDDHHSGPNGGCHHHVLHCGCSHAQPMALFAASGVAAQTTTDFISTPPLISQVNLDLKNIFHIPIA